MKIAEFHKQLLKRGVSRPYNFKVEITTPTKLINSDWWNKFSISSEIEKILEFQCTSTSFPTTNISTSEGLYKTPTGVTYSDLSIDIRCGKDLMEKKFFDAWYAMTINQDNHLISYLDDISTVLKLIKLDNNDKIIQTIQYYDVFPKSVSGLEANHDSGSIDTFKVEFAYRKWKFV